MMVKISGASVLFQLSASFHSMSFLAKSCDENRVIDNKNTESFIIKYVPIMYKVN